LEELFDPVMIMLFALHNLCNARGRTASSETSTIIY
jgi:hypothetical protein